MKISIVTVAFNEEKNIAKTIESVLNQKSNAIEYIICDGKSMDKTIEIANSYKEKFVAKGINYIVNSEKDAGIYDGMNKGIDIATGDYIFFLNAGDWFYANEIIEKVIETAEENRKPDFVYGNVALIERGIVKFVNGADEELQDRMSIPHQALFSATQLMKQNKFDLKYKIAADYKFILSQKILEKRFIKLDETIAFFSGGGLSNKRLVDMFKEHNAIQQEFGVFVEGEHKKSEVYINQVKATIKSFIPQKLWEIWSVKVKGKTLYKE